MSRKGRNLTDEQKKRFLIEHYSYEVRELIYCVWFFICSKQHEVGVQPSVEQFLINTSLDHFLLHARNLLEFYYRTARPEKYANAREFISGWTATMSPSMKVLDRRVYPEVTHLAWDRLLVQHENKKWDLSDIAIDLLATTERFLELLDEKYKNETLQQLAGEAAQYHKNIRILKEGRGGKVADMFKALESAGHRW